MYCETLLSIVKDKSFQETKSEVSKHGLHMFTDEAHPNLYMISCLKQDNDITQIQREGNGIILEKETNKVVCAGLPIMLPVQEHVDNTGNNTHKTIIMPSYDGTIVRLFHYDNEWNLCTNRKLNGKSAFWRNKNDTYYNMFWDTISNKDEFVKGLKTNYTYIYVLIHPKNKMIIDYGDEKTSILTCVINNDTMTEEPINLSFENINLQARGYIIKQKMDENVYQYYKYDYPEYVIYSTVLGNVAMNPVVRYLELYNKDPYMLKYFKDYYTHYNWDYIDSKIETFVNDVYLLYKITHIKHLVEITPEHQWFKLVKMLHKRYKTSKQAITVNSAKEVVFSMNKKNLCELMLPEF